jgi:exodeoxyribonuclease V beta subunit
MSPTPFHIAGPLPAGFTVLEASAGTGKTYSLAGLVTRFVAEHGLEASQLCVVSFTEAATAELRGRIRAGLVAAHAHLAAGAPDDGSVTDDVVRAVAADPEARSVRERRLEAALADFDAATIATIHGFCSRVVASGSGADLPLTADDSDVDELVADHVLARYGATGDWPAKPKHVADAVRLRLQLPDAAMFTVDPLAVGPKAAARQRATDLIEIADLVEDVVAAVRRRRAAARRRTFDGLLTDARELLQGPDGEATRAALQARFRLVMIDEFQDTDQVQWDIFRTAFLEGHQPATVVVVGDPKQSIYRFRSAELSAYLDARSRASTVTSLDTNWRSDAPVLDGLGKIFAGYQFGDPQVAFQPVSAAPGREKSALTDGSGPLDAAVQLRCLDGDLRTNEARVRARDDMVAEVVRLLGGDVHLHDGEAGSRPLRASDIGVLVRSNADATRFVAALARAGVPAASSSNDSVLDSPAAQQWRILLSALERPAAPARARAAALGWFLGHGAAELDAMGDDGLGDLAEQLRSWAGALLDGGLPRLVALARATGLLERVLGRPGGERDLTDLDHVQELMQSVVGGRPVGAAALLGVLDDLAVGGSDVGEEFLAPELLSRRIDRDDDTVKVLTVHRAKGLEFPVVLCPTLWTARPKRQGLPHAQTADGRRIDTNCMRRHDPGKGGRTFTVIEQADKGERAGEDSRLLYVALTRARHRLVLWWQPHSKGSPPLAELLAHAGGGTLDPHALGAASGGAIDVVDVGPPGRPAVLAAPGGEPAPLAVARVERRLDDRWRIWSFTAVKAAADAAAAAHGSGVAHGRGAAHGGAIAAGTTADVPPLGGVDEPSADEPLTAAELGAPAGPGVSGPDGAGGPTALQGAPAGTTFGTLVHGLLERVDFAAPDLAGELHDHAVELLAHRPLPVAAAELAAALVPALSTPLGEAAGGRTLRDLTRADRLDELGFDLPLAAFSAAELAAVVADGLPVDDPLAPWFRQAADGGLEVRVEGLLTGSIDLVARTDGRYWLADYKTNLLVDGDYGPGALAAAMAHHGYPLQATLYLVALHRYLRWRLPGYDCDRHLAGAAYLFLRGMRPDAPGRGIVWWRPPTAAIEALDRLLARGRAA